MARFRKVNIIMGDNIIKWDTMCLAEYFFFSHFDTGCETSKFHFYNCEEYYRSNTRLVSYQYIIKKRKRCVSNGKIKYIYDYNLVERIVISKRDNYRGWHVVFESDNMDETAAFLFSMNDIYTISWHTTFQEFISAYKVLKRR